MKLPVKKPKKVLDTGGVVGYYGDRWGEMWRKVGTSGQNCG